MMYTLRFDVETLIIATYEKNSYLIHLLRFDVETLIIATVRTVAPAPTSCGLM